MLPNYDTPSILVSSLQKSELTFTAPSNGYIMGSGYGENNTNTYIYLSIGDVKVKSQNNNGDNVGVCMPIRKGDVVKINMWLALQNNGLYFVPAN